MPPQLQRTDYHVAWICPVSDLERLPSLLMLDEKLAIPSYDTRYDKNAYHCGRMAGHTVVIAACPPGMTGNVNAGRLSTDLFNTFPNIRMALLVGIGGGVPRATISEDSTHNIHLGDVVVGWPGDGGPAVVYYDSGRQRANGQFDALGTIDRPDTVLLNAFAKLKSDVEMDCCTFSQHREKLAASKHKHKFAFPGSDKDRLYRATYIHGGQYGDGCSGCNDDHLVKRPLRPADNEAHIIFHSGRIATGNAVMQDGVRRDQIRDRHEGTLCVEMEAAGVDASRPCLVIRGVSDYADSHKGDAWRSYAAGNAAIFARELLGKIPPATVASADGRKIHFLVPFGRNKVFVSRGSYMEEILARIPPNADKDDCQRTVIAGLGGIGKTQLAIEATYRLREAHPDCSIFWVPAVNQTMFENGYRDIGRALSLSGIDDNKADMKMLVKSALNSEESGNWLLVIDNADDKSLLFDGPMLSSWLPFSRTGSILFTTRDRAMAVSLNSRDQIISVDCMSAVEAAELLQQDLELSQISDSQSKDNLLRALCYLPLAIKQASAFMKMNRNVSIPDYLGLITSSDAALVQLLSEDFSDQDRYDTTQNPVATTWLISFEQLRRDNSLAARYLGLICHLAEKDIPSSLFLKEQDRIADAKAVGALQAYAFISQRNAPDRFDIHRLVRLMMQMWLQEQGKDKKLITETFRALRDRLPWPEYGNRDEWRAYLPHTETALVVADKCFDTEAACEVIIYVGTSQAYMYNGIKVTDALRKLITLSTKTLGRRHAITLERAHVLAYNLMSEGHLEQSQEILRDILQLPEASLNRDALKIVQECRDTYVTVLTRQGEFEKAQSLCRQSLKACLELFGEWHDDTLATKHRLAVTLVNQSRHEEATKMARQTLEATEKVHGPDHHYTLLARSGLGDILQRQGKLDEAEKVYQGVLEMKQQIFGVEHPNTLDTKCLLADVFAEQGEYEASITMHQETLKAREKVIGTTHPDTFQSRCSLAWVLYQQGELPKAARMYQETLEAREKFLGPDHPGTLNSKYSLAWVLHKQGELPEAERLFRETLEARKKVMGLEHSQTLDSKYEVACVLYEQGELLEAERMHRETLEAREKVKGPNHTDTLYSKYHLAKVLHKQGELPKAERMHRETLGAMEKVIGRDHPDTLRCRDGLAEVLREQGELFKAEEMYRGTLKAKEMVIGPEHSSTLRSRNELAKMLHRQGKHSDGKKIRREMLTSMERVLGQEHHIIRILRASLEDGRYEGALGLQKVLESRISENVEVVNGVVDRVRIAGEQCVESESGAQGEVEDTGTGIVRTRRKRKRPRIL